MSDASSPAEAAAAAPRATAPAPAALAASAAEVAAASQASAPGPAFDAKQLRAALGRFATGVTIVTCVADGPDGPERIGLTANSFQSLSLEPPLVLWSLRTQSPSLAAFAAARHFAVNVLAEAQVDLSRRFAQRLPDKFAEGPWADGAHGGAPVLAGSAAVFECEVFAQHPAGDHVLFIGRVLAFSESAVPPLVYQAGHYRLLGEIL